MRRRPAGFLFLVFIILSLAAPVRLAAEPGRAVTGGEYIADIGSATVKVIVYKRSSHPGWEPFDSRRTLYSPEPNRRVLVRLDVDVDGMIEPVLFLPRNIFAFNIYQDDARIYEFSGPADFRAGGAWQGWNYHVVRLYRSMTGPLYLEIYAPQAMPMPGPRIGERTEVIRTLFLESLPGLFVGGLALLAGVLMLGAYAYQRKEQFVALAGFYLCIGVWLLVLTGFAPYFVKEGTWRAWLEYGSLFLAPIGMFAFAEQAFASRWHRVTRVIRWALAAYAALALLLSALGVIGLWRSLLPWQILILISFLFFVTIVFRAALRGSPEARILSIGVVLLMLGAANDILVAMGVITTGLWMHWAALGLFLSLGGIVAYQYGALRNALERKNASLQEMNRLKDEFLANTSHELRTPLHGIAGIAESLLAGAAGRPSQLLAENLNMILASSRRLATLVNDILDASRLKRKDLDLQFKFIDLRVLCGLVAKLGETLRGDKDLAIVLDLPDQPVLVRGDENRLQQILLNLVGNAIKFTEQGEVRIRIEREGDLIRVLVQDTGIGIPAGRLEKIFEAFEQADGSTARRYGGTGLGLSIARELARLHDGSLEVESTPGAGSVFALVLPTAPAGTPDESGEGRVFGMRDETAAGWQADRRDEYPEDASDPEAVADSAPRASGQGAGAGAKILIVDDEPVNRRVLRNLLEIEGYEIVECSDGPAALELLESQSPALVLLDIMMPAMTGYEVCRRIRADRPAGELPIILLTARTRITDLTEGFASGANDYLTKPFSTRELLTRVSFHLSLGRATAELRHMRDHLEDLVTDRTEHLNRALGELKAKDDEMENELILASEIQSRLLARLPHEGPLCTVHGHYLPLHTVSGDFFDIVRRPDGSTAFLLADATGHGVPAALIISMAKIVFNDGLGRFESPADILAHLNNVMEKNISSTSFFLTACLLFIQPGGRMLYASGAHLPAYVLRSGATELERLDPDGVIIGALEQQPSAFPVVDLQANPGDRIYLYTDGILEYRGKNQEDYGEDRLRRLLLKTRDRSPEEVKSALLEDLRQFSGGDAARDDITFLCIELR